MIQRTTLLVVLFASLASTATIAEKTTGMDKVPGYFTYYWDAKAGKVWLEIDRWDTEFLYVNSLIAASRCE